MSRQSLLRTSLIAALILGSVAGSITTSFAATTGRGGGSSSGGNGGGSSGGGASAGGGGGNGGGTSVEARLVATNPDCRTRVCNPPPVYVPAKFVEPSRCTNVWRKVTLQDGTVVEDRSVALRRHCRVIRPFE